MATRFNAISFLLRWVFALLLVVGTYNPSEYSFIGWILSPETELGPPMALIGMVLLIAWIVFLRATFLSLGWLGIALGAALCASLVWLLIDLQWLSLDSGDALTWVALVILSLILAVGMAWSHIRRRLTGQFDVDDIED